MVERKLEFHDRVSAVGNTTGYNPSQSIQHLFEQFGNTDYMKPSKYAIPDRVAECENTCTVHYTRVGMS
jgi:hypothetical protein